MKTKTNRDKKLKLDQLKITSFRTSLVGKEEGQFIRGGIPMTDPGTSECLNCPKESGPGDPDSC